MIKNILIFIIISSNLFGQNFSNGFNFTLPPRDTITAKYLPKFPVKKLSMHDFISINANGNFAVNNSKIKFWGTNCVADGAFPDTDKAWFIAGRLRKMGFNLIRFHHMDNGWGAASLFEYGKDTRHLSAINLNKLDKFISELKNNGIYADINLNVSRTFKTLDGVADADSIIDFGKGVTIFDPQLIFLQKEYASQLLKHINPNTGLALTDDPVMALVEIINENSLYRMWHDGKLKPFSQNGSLTIRHVKMLDSLWNKYLADKYNSTTNIETEWNAGITPVNGSNFLINGNFESPQIKTNWTIELDDPAASAVMSKDSINSYSGLYSAKISVTHVSGTDWHIQWKQVGFSVKKDSLYNVEFAARADSECTLNITVMRDNDPYTSYGWKSFQITSKWQVYSFSVKPLENNTGQTRLSFSFNNRVGTFWFDEVKFSSANLKGILAGETIESGTVKRIDYSDCSSFTDSRVKDMSAFYINLQDVYFASMKSFLKDTLGVKIPITGTNWNAGPGDLTSQSKMDYLDNHAYWDHPSFPNIPWSSTDWSITNQAMVKSTDGGTIPGLFGGIPFKGKPFTVSEYNHGYPNRYQSEAMLFITSYGAFNDADAIMFFDYNGSSDWETDMINGYFDIHRNPAYLSLSPSCAFAFRNNFISKSDNVLTIDYTSDKINLLPKNDNGSWQGPPSFTRKLALKYAIRNESFNSAVSTDFSSFPAEPVNPFVTTTNEIIYNTDGLLTTAAKNFIGAAGFLNNFPGIQIANLQIISASDFGVITWLSLSDDSLPAAGTSLLTVSSRAQNSGMIWDGITSIHDRWGSQPTVVSPLDVSLKLNIYADSIKVYPLDTRGVESNSIYTIYYPSEADLFVVRINQNDSKSLWFGIEKFGKGAVNEINENTNSSKFSYALKQNYPNPFNPSTRITFSIPTQERVSLKLFDILGRKIATLINEEKPAGVNSYLFDNANFNLSSGIYFYQLRADGYVYSKKLILLK